MENAQKFAEKSNGQRELHICRACAGIIRYRKEIEEVIRDNKHTFGYDREVQFQEETISQYAEEMAHKLFTKAIEMGNIRFDEELPGYVDEFGMQINEYDFKLTKLCRDAAKVELLEEYNAAYKSRI